MSQRILPGFRSARVMILPEPLSFRDGGELVLTIPAMRLVNPTNEHTHWRVRAKRAKHQRGTAEMLCRCAWGRPPSPPLVITIVRTGPGKLDSDSLPASGKHVRDGIADWLGVDDGSGDLDWRYEQTKGGRGEYAVTIRIRRAG